MKTRLDTARHFLPTGTPGEVAHAYNRAALAAMIATRATSLGLGSDMTQPQMAALAQLVRDTPKSPALSAQTRTAIRAALRPALRAQDDPAIVSAAVFAALPDTSVRVADATGREYLLIAVPAA
jgi:hypothetical protein